MRLKKGLYSLLLDFTILDIVIVNTEFIFKAFFGQEGIDINVG